MILKFLDSIAQIPVIIPLLALFFFFSYYLFPKSHQAITKAAGKEIKILDSRLSYNKEEVTKLFADLGPQGRAIYRAQESRLDMLFPLVYGAMFLVLYAFFLKTLFGPDSAMLYFSFIPASTLIFDYLENINIIRMLDNHQQLTEPMVSLSSAFTSIKYLMFVASLIGILLLLVICFYFWIIKRF